MRPRPSETSEGPPALGSSQMAGITSVARRLLSHFGAHFEILHQRRKIICEKGLMLGCQKGRPPTALLNAFTTFSFVSIMSVIPSYNFSTTRLCFSTNHLME